MDHDQWSTFTDWLSNYINNDQLQIDFKAVGKTYGITPIAAQYRFYRVRDYMAKLDALNQKVMGNDGEEDDEKDDELVALMGLNDDEELLTEDQEMGEEI